MNNILFIWDSKPINYIDVCLQSLRLYNTNCNIYFYYYDDEIKNRYYKYNINFIKINYTEFKNKRMFYKINSTYQLIQKLDINSRLLILDCDLLFQNDPFIMFDKYKNYDLYYTTSVMTQWININYCVNGGVWGINVNDNTRHFMSFWIDNMIHPSWDKWINNEHRINHIDSKLDWWIDQDFLNCVSSNVLPIPLKKINVGYKFNYFTSTWGYFSKYLKMHNKINNKNYVIIHFKATFKETYNINNESIYNLKNILNNKSLITKESDKSIYKKFMSRGENRYKVI